jgi:hypothetical protein
VIAEGPTLWIDEAELAADAWAAAIANTPHLAAQVDAMLPHAAPDGDVQAND